MSATTENASPAAPAPVNGEASAPEADGFRVHVGNLPFTATEEEVREHMSKSGGKITSVILPVRFKSRPAGYAFVIYDKEEDAKDAVEKYNDTDLGGRTIHVQLARSREENAERRKAQVDKRRKSKTADGEQPEAVGETTAGESEKPADKDKSKKKKKATKSSRRRGPEDGDETAVEAEAEAAGETAEPKKAKESKKRKPRLQLTGEVSTNTVFVANLPFTVDDDQLASIFSDLSIAVKSAHVIRGVRDLPGRRSFRGSRGFGFVVLENDSQQAEAVEKVNGMAVGDRKVTAKVAQEMKPIDEEGAEGKTGEAADTAAAEPKAEAEVAA